MNIMQISCVISSNDMSVVKKSTVWISKLPACQFEWNTILAEQVLVLKTGDAGNTDINNGNRTATTCHLVLLQGCIKIDNP